jgi:hypothetical protein
MAQWTITLRKVEYSKYRFGEQHPDNMDRLMLMLEALQRSAPRQGHHGPDLDLPDAA